MSSLDYLDLCRLCLVKDRASVPIFEGEGDVRQIFLKIAACLPVKVVRGDKLPKKICDDCVYKVEQFYQFWNTTANVEKQLLQWLGDVGMEDKQAYVSGVLNPDQSVEGRLNANVIQQTDEHQNNMGMNMMDTMNLDMPMMMQTEQSQMTTMNSNDTNVQTIQAVPGTSVRPPQQERRKDDEDESSEDEDNSDDECDADEGLSVKEETEETANRTIEPTFVNVSLPCDEAGPSGLQQQKINEMSDMVMAQSTDGDPKSGSKKLPVLRVKSLSRLLPNDGRIQISKNIDGRNLTVGTFEKTIDKTPRLMKPKIVVVKTPMIKNQEESTLKRSIQNVFKVPVTEKISPSAFRVKRFLITAKLPNNTFKRSYKFECTHCKATFFCQREDDPDGMKFYNSHSKRHSFNCSIETCSRKFNSSNELLIHMKLEHTAKKYNCNFCEFSSNDRFSIINHLENIHKIPTDLDTKKKRKSLKKMDESALCQFCGYTAKNINTLGWHLRQYHTEKKLICPICQKRLASPIGLELHRRIHEKPEIEEKIPHVCELCEKTFTSSCGLRTHMLVHTGEKPHKCNICGRAFAKRNTLRQHLLIHSGKRPYACDICEKTFVQKPGLTAHRKSHPGNHPPIPNVFIDPYINIVDPKSVHPPSARPKFKLKSETFEEFNAAS